jgi:hypothetical protein
MPSATWATTAAIYTFLQRSRLGVIVLDNVEQAVHREILAQRRLASAMQLRKQVSSHNSAPRTRPHACSEPRQERGSWWRPVIYLAGVKTGFAGPLGRACPMVDLIFDLLRGVCARRIKPGPSSSSSVIAESTVSRVAVKTSRVPRTGMLKLNRCRTAMRAPSPSAAQAPV